MKQFILTLMIVALGVFSINAESNSENKLNYSTFQSIDNPVYFAEGVKLKPHDAVLYAQSEQPSESITPEEIADIIDEKVLPLIEEASDQIRTAPDKGSEPVAWVSWGLTALVSFFGAIMAIFFSGGSENRGKNLKTT